MSQAATRRGPQFASLNVQLRAVKRFLIRASRGSEADAIDPLEYVPAASPESDSGCAPMLSNPTAVIMRGCRHVRA
jgi:hypothetical protein